MITYEQKRDVAREICRNYGITLSVEALKAFANILMPMKVLKGRELVSEGDVCKNIFYVERGLVLQYYKKNNVTVTEHISHEGDMVICIESYFLQEPSKIIATMIEPGLVYAIPRDTLQMLASQSFEFCKLIFAIDERSLIISQRKADILRFETAKERYVRTLKENPEIIRRAPLHHVASFLQMTPETLSRVRAQVSEEEGDL
ncbi:MAG: Crp/Fnr family transcriptional regulator [Prevotellaceae bacterium]|nr:Crp/Fnr family transcriptional regulator [Candidatus Minthosoma caballi]